MADVLIIGPREEPELETLIKAFERKGYRVAVLAPSETAQVNGKVYDGVISFAASNLADTLRARNPSLVEIARDQLTWYVRKGIGKHEPIEDIFLDAHFWLAAKQNRKSTGAYSLRKSDILRRMKEAPSSEAFYEAGMLALEEHRREDAFDAFRTATEHDPPEMEALCQLLELVNEYPELSKKLDQRNWFTRNLFAIFSNEADIDSKGRAIAYIRQIIYDNATRPEPFVYLGEMYVENGNLTGAFQAYRDAISRMGAAGIDEFLRANDRDEDAKRKLQVALRLEPDRITRVFPSKYRIRDVVLKAYPPAEAKNANIEDLLITHAQYHRDQFRLPDGKQINLPTRSTKLKDPNDARTILRIDRVPGKNAYDDLARLDPEARFQLLKKLTITAATLDHNFTHVVAPESPEIRFLLSDPPENFLQDRLRKFFDPLERMLGAPIPREDRQVIDAGARFADHQLLHDTTPWLTTLRLDHVPKNYVLDFDGNRSDTAKFIKECVPGHFDMEHAQLVNGLWGVTTLFGWPGAEIDRKHAFQLALLYVTTRLIAYKNLSMQPEEVLNVPEKEGDRYRVFNALLNKNDPSYAVVEPLRGTRAAPAEKTRFLFLLERWARHLEIAGTWLTLEAENRQLLREVERRIPPAALSATGVELGTGEEAPYAQMLRVHQKVQRYGGHLHGDKLFHLGCAREALRLLAQPQDIHQRFPELMRLHTLFENRGYFKKAEDVLSNGS
ncbi:hypothetical protein HY493_04695 [Candidatus Woesearchaeota archaeon]|nr:hypothetical protein [Candidatus Woesearchaeota archaeon]